MEEKNQSPRLGDLWSQLKANRRGNLKESDYESLLNTAYRSENPLETFQAICLTEFHIDLVDVLWLVENIDFIQLEPFNATKQVPPMERTVADLVNLHRWVQSEKHSQQAIVSHFLYFATSLIHLWGYKRDDLFLLELSRPLVCYVEPNCPSRYIWFQVEPSSGLLLLQKHNLYSDDYGDEKPFRVMMHRTLAPGRMDKLRFTFDLTTRKSMTSVRNTDGMMHLSVRLDKHCPATFGSRCKVIMGARYWGNFVVVLTVGKDNVLDYLGYNVEVPEENKSVVYLCKAALHEIKV